MVERGEELFIGEYRHNIDDKGRLIIPSKFREELGNSFILTRGLDNCIFVYTHSEWSKLEQKLKTLSFTKADARAFTRFFFSGACEVEIDKNGRINVPANLRTFAALTKECVILGLSSRIEIWCLNNWDTYNLQSEESFNSIAENIVDLEL